MTSNLATIHPKTLEGLKRLAKQIKKSEGIQYCDALTKAAQQGGFDSYIEALNYFKHVQAPS